MADLLLDTDILIDTSRGVPEAVEFLQRGMAQSVVGISTVTQLELVIGCRNRTEQRRVERFLQRFEVVRLNELVADRAVDLIRQYRLSHGLLLADALIAATALSLNIPLATKNQRDYRFVTGLHLLSYP
ncbi:MAG: PIN domain-containing protein [Anaerolineae bacterium]|nr:PIN domain-containing protein [Anaerolineae bacterium]